MYTHHTRPAARRIATTSVYNHYTQLASKQIARTHARTHARTGTQTHTHAHTHARTRTHTHAHAHTHTHTHTRVPNSPTTLNSKHWFPTSSSNNCHSWIGPGSRKTVSWRTVFRRWCTNGGMFVRDISNYTRRFFHNHPRCLRQHIWNPKSFELYPYPPPPYPLPPFSPSLINLMVSVDVQYHVYITET